MVASRRRWLTIGIFAAGLAFLLVPSLNEVLVVDGLFMLVAVAALLDGAGLGFLEFPVVLIAGLSLVALPLYALFEAATWAEDRRWPADDTRWPRIKRIALACGAGGWMALALFQLTRMSMPFTAQMTAQLCSALVKIAISATVLRGLQIHGRQR